MILNRWDPRAPCATVGEMRINLHNLSWGLGKWSNETFGSVRREIKKLKQMLEELRNDPLRTAPSNVELTINEQLIEMYHREEIMW